MAFIQLIVLHLQGDSGGLGLGYVDINSVSFGGYPETELSQHNPVRDHQNHPVVPRLVEHDCSYPVPKSEALDLTGHPVVHFFASRRRKGKWKVGESITFCSGP